MPIVYTDNVWKALYSFGQHYYSRDTYNNVAGFRRQFQDRCNWLMSFEFDQIIVIGPGLGFLMEHLLDQGIDNVWGIEPSPFVWDNLDQIRGDVRDRLVRGAIGISVFRDTLIFNELIALGFDESDSILVVDEDAISSQLSDYGVHNFIMSCDILAGQGKVVHIVTPTPGRDTQILWKSIDEWEAFAPHHFWIDARIGNA